MINEIVDTIVVEGGKYTKIIPYKDIIKENKLEERILEVENRNNKVEELIQEQEKKLAKNKKEDN